MGPHYAYPVSTPVYVLNANVIVATLENKLLHKGKDIQTQIHPRCKCEYYSSFYCKVLAINTHFFRYWSPVDNF